MKKSTKFLSLLLVAAMMLSLLTACGGGKTESDGTPSVVQTEGKTELSATVSQTVIEGKAATEAVDNVTLVLGGASFDIGPFGGASGPRDFFVNQLYGALICIPYFGAQLEDCELWMAKDIEKVDDMTYKVYLYDYITDSKGNAITAEDVKFSYEQCASVGQPECITTCLDSIDIIDDYTLQFNLYKTGAGIVENLFGNYRMNIVDKEWFEGASDNDKIYDIATTGPYVVKSFDPGASLILERNPNYWQTNEELNPCYGKANAQQITYKVITETSMVAVGLENGELDWGKVAANDAYHFYDASTGTSLEGYNVTVAPAAGFNGILLNMDTNSGSPLADNENLRKAVLCAIRGEDVMYANGVEYGQGDTCDAFATNVMAGYDMLASTDEYYPQEKAQEYMDASGYGPGEVTLKLCMRTSATSDATASVFVASLEAIGINVDLLVVDQGLFNTYRYDSSTWDIFYDSKRSSGQVTDIWDILFNPSGYQNGDACFNNDEELVNLLDAAVRNFDEESLNAFSDYLYDKACVKALYTAYSFYVAQDGVLQQYMSAGLNPAAQAFTYSEDYVSNGTK